MGLCLLAMIAGCAPRAGESPAGTRAAMGTVEVGGHLFFRERLGNGLTAIAVRDPDAPRGTSSVFVVYGVGRRMENEATSGLAHLTEHTLFTGTKKTPAGKHDERIRALGGEPNAYTRDDYTLYYDHRIPRTGLAEVLAMEADRMRGLIFDPEAFLEERAALEREERGTRSRARRRQERIEAAVFQRHPYRFGVPDEQGLSRAPELPLETVREFYDRWYHPERCAVVVSGDVDPPTALERIRTIFGEIPVGPPVPGISVEEIAGTERSLDLESKLSRIVTHHLWVGPARVEFEGGAVDRIALEVLAAAVEMHLVDSEPPIHLQAPGRLDRDLFSISTSGENAFSRLEGLRSRMLGNASDGQAWPSEQSVREAIDRARRAPSRTPLSSGRPYFSLAGRMGIHAALGQPDHLAERDRILASLGRSDLRSVARRWLRPEGRVEIRMLPSSPAGTPLPDDPAALAEAARDAAAVDDLERAIAAFEKLLALGPGRMNRVIYLYSLGELHMAADDLDAARARLVEALEVVEYAAVRELLEEVDRRRDEVSRR